MKRIYHTWEKWECYPAGFYNDHAPPGVADPRRAYADFLRDDAQFRAALERVLEEWPDSCEHYLSNENMNRIAWLGQASACIALGLPAAFRGGFNLLTPEEKAIANQSALDALNRWLEARGEEPKTQEAAQSLTVPNLY